MAVILCGAVSAADSSDVGGGAGLPDVNSSDASLVDPIIDVNVNYEYKDDTINPEITVKDSSDVNIKFNTTVLPKGKYRLSFDYPGVVNGALFKIIVKAPGYIEQTQNVRVYQSGTDPNFYGDATFNMKATDNYKLGREVVKKADELLKFKNADKILCITTAGLAYRNGVTTQDCLEGILNGSNGLITYGKGNLLTFQSTRTDPLDFCFVVKKGSSLTAAFFQNGSLKPAYHGTFSKLTQDLWKKTLTPKLGKNAFGYVSLSHAWSEGLSTDILRQAAYHGHVCLGTLSGQAMISVLLKYYPPGVYGNLGELEATTYRAISVPGGSDDDAYIYSLDLTSGKRSWVGYETNADSNLVGFIKWCDKTKTGTLIIMRFNEQAVVNLFKKETGIKAYSGIVSELKFNSWLMKKLENDPESLVEIPYVFENINIEIHNQLTGGYDSKQVVCDARGLDMDYILGLGLTNVADQRVATNYNTGSLTPAQIKDIGKRAANQAINLFKEAGIDLLDYVDSSKLFVFTTAGYVRVNEQVMDMTMDGIYDVLGSRLSRATLLPVHNARFNPLYFQFTLVKDGKFISKTLTYNETDGSFIPKNGSSCIIDQVILYNPPYDALMAWLWHNHVCGGSSPGYLITNYIYDNFPLGDDESYALIGNSISCRDDIYSYLLGISPGAGTYFSQRMTSKTTGNDILVISIYDSKTKTRRVAIVNWTNPRFKPGSNSYEEYIKLYWGDTSSPNLLTPPKISLTADTWVTEAEWKQIISGNSLDVIKGIPVRTKEELIKIQGGNLKPNDGSNQGNQGGSSQGGSSSTGSLFDNGSGATGYVGSVGDSGVNVSAASETTTSADSEAGDAGKSGKSYEVTKAGAQGTDNTPWGTYAVVGVLSVLALAGVGFFFRGSLFGE
ncbi:FmdE family protein [Methanobacterium sp. MZD130B]|uniref:FmdE family protein n=1 Tax=Methanobacterium sp. MZD130B TaxID=3394378 RepID=UPI0039FD48C2